MNMRSLFYLVMAPLVLVLAACSGTQTFTPAARAGDTVTLAVGWKKNLLRQNLTVTITDANGVKTTYLPNDSRVRAILNLYPDPASYAVVDTAAGLTTNGSSTGDMVNQSVTNGDNDWWQTSIVLDLPSTMAPGTATVALINSAGTTFQSLGVTIVPGTGTSNLFNIYFGGISFPLLGQGYFPGALASFEREPNSTVNFSNSNLDTYGNPIVPHSIQMQFTHTAGTGTTWIVNPRGDLKDVTWTDSGSVITVMLMSTNGSTLAQLLDFKFYISGGIINVAQVANSLKAYDINGNPITGVTAQIH